MKYGIVQKSCQLTFYSFQKFAFLSEFGRKLLEFCMLKELGQEFLAGYIYPQLP